MKITSNQKLIIDILGKYSCSTAKEISMLAKREHNTDISPASVSGSIRALYNNGMIGKSPDANGHTVYWLSRKG